MNLSHSLDTSFSMRIDQALLDRLDRLTLILRGNPQLAVGMGISGKVTRGALIESMLQEQLEAVETRLRAR